MSADRYPSARRAIIGAAGFERNGVEGFDRFIAVGDESDMLALRMRVEEIDPVDWIVALAIADSLFTALLRNLGNPAEAQSSEGGIVKCARPRHVSNPDACMVDTPVAPHHG